VLLDPAGTVEDPGVAQWGRAAIEAAEEHALPVPGVIGGAIVGARGRPAQAQVDPLIVAKHEGATVDLAGGGEAAKGQQQLVGRVVHQLMALDADQGRDLVLTPRRQLDGAPRGAAVVADQIMIVALLADGVVDHAVATALGRGAVGAAAIAADHVAVVAGLARPGGAVAADHRVTEAVITGTTRLAGIAADLAVGLTAAGLALGGQHAHRPHGVAGHADRTDEITAARRSGLETGGRREGRHHQRHRCQELVQGRQP
jgi:hypothetical protein